MPAHHFSEVWFLHTVKVVYKSVFDSETGLSYILDSTSSAGDAVDQVGTPAGDFSHALVCSFTGIAHQVPCFVQEFAISAVESIAEAETPLAWGCTSPGFVGHWGLLPWP